MWLFGQVWFACLVGFAVGVALDWVVRVRPLSKQVADLESRLASANRKIAGQDGDSPEGYRRSVFDRGQFDEDGFVGNRNRGGLLTPSDDPTLLAPDPREVTEIRPYETARTEIVSSGVEDFPGVARLSGAWDTDRTEAVPPPPAVTETWQPITEPAQPYDTNELYEDETPSSGTLEPAEQPYSDSGQRPGQPPYSEQNFADQQYLEFLRAGANHAPVEPEEGEVSSGGLVYGKDYTGQDFAAPDQPVVPESSPAETTGELSDESASEVTSVLPAIHDEAPSAQVDNYEAYESYAQEDYQQNGYAEPGYVEPGYAEPGYESQPAHAAEPGYAEPGYAADSGYRAEPAHAAEPGYADTGYQYGSYQPEEFEEPAESSSPLPRRSAGDQPRRFTPFAPFDVPFSMSEDSDLVDVQPRSGELTPIEEGGFQPFQKPSIEEPGYTPEYSDGAWIGDDGQLVGSDSLPPLASNGAHVLAEPDDGASSWFNQNEAQEAAAHSAASSDSARDSVLHESVLHESVLHGDSTMTQRMLPVSRPDLDHPDLLPQSVFGTEGDNIYEDDGPVRSLFEPVVQPEAIIDDFSVPDQLSSPGPSSLGPSSADPSSGGFSSAGSSSGYSSAGPSSAGSSTAGLSSPGFSPPQDDSAPSDEFLSQATAPRPVRVRTGVDGTESQSGMSPVPQPEDVGGGSTMEAASGPFGPGSALPNPDGSAPSPEFRIKARTSSMVFHTESSPFYERLEPQVWFRDAEDAQRAGFTSWERPRSW